MVTTWLPTSLANWRIIPSTLLDSVGPNRLMIGEFAGSVAHCGDFLPSCRNESGELC